MVFDLFDRTVLQKDFPEAGLKRGDVGIVVEHVIREGDEDGYIVEFFDAQGNTVDKTYSTDFFVTDRLSPFP